MGIKKFMCLNRLFYSPMQILHQGAPEPGGAGQGQLLAHRPAERGQAHRASLPAAAAARGSLLPGAIWPELTVSSFGRSPT